MDNKNDDGLAATSPVASAVKTDMGPEHVAPHPGKDALLHTPVPPATAGIPTIEAPVYASPLGDSALLRAEAAYDDERMLERLDAAIEEKLVRNGKRDG